MSDADLALATVAAALGRLAPGLSVTIAQERSLPVLEVRTPLIPQGIARVQVAYRPDGFVMMALEPSGSGTGATAHARSPDPDVIANAIAGWATRPLRVALPKPVSPEAARARVLSRLRSAIADAAAPPPLRPADALPGADAALIAFHYPRDRRGRMQAAARVLVEVLAPGPPGRRSRCRFLRLQGGAIEVFESEEFVENQDHRWHEQPWRWRRDALATPRTERWGTPDIDSAMAAANRLEAGDHEGAFAAGGLRLGDQLRKVLAGEPLSALQSDDAARWGTVAADELTGLAPWRLPPIAGRTWMRLFGLGGSMAQVKPVVAVGLAGGRPALEVTGLGSNRRLARNLWERPLDFEAERIGVALPPALDQA